ncbi:amidohydrolase family protein [Sphingomonas aracearum]|uniref:Amidohydrolase n=1 Tax=Sphingomonas aracearum TaxID=2283317 RepID=A0A369VXE0_9SPHN|nr:amidohydrolase family protein [Sphingomonas aracearum]RDE06988.1 amidohydrolase [Sphingomonas aracearum]
MNVIDDSRGRSRKKRARAKLLPGGLLAALPLLLGAAAGSPADEVTAITGATIFDATGAAPHVGTVVIRGDRIVAVGQVTVPRGARVIDARGKALLPGFFDVHTHWTPAGAPATLPQIATSYVRSGVTTVNDFHEQPESYAPRRKWLAGIAAPHVNFAARISTPGGHGADWGDQATTIWINTPEAARAAIERLKPYKPDLIKAFTDGWRYGAGPDNSSMDEGTLKALVQASHAAGLKVLTHTVTVDRGAIAARAGIDGLGHGLQDRPIDPDSLKTIVQSGMAMAPTLAVYEPGKNGASPDPSDPRVKSSLRKFGYALGNVKAMHAAGVPIALGTDAGMPGTPHGSSSLHEMELLVRAGLTPAQALIAGTATSAKVMNLDADRGTIQPGKRADIVLIDGRPWENIADVRKIASVLIDGRLVVGPGAPPLPAGNAATRLPSAPVAPLIDDFERADRRTALDTLRLEDTDGGISRSVEITQLVPRGTGHALQVAARLAIKQDATAGVSFPLTRGSVRPVTVRRYRALRFALKGTGSYTVRFIGDGGEWSAAVQGTRDWTEQTVPFSALQPVSSARRRGAPWTGEAIYEVEIGAARGPGETLAFELDDLRFQ